MPNMVWHPNISLTCLWAMNQLEPWIFPESPRKLVKQHLAPMIQAAGTSFPVMLGVLQHYRPLQAENIPF